MYKRLFILFLGAVSSTVYAMQQGPIGTITISGTIFVEPPCRAFVTQEELSIDCQRTGLMPDAKTLFYSLPTDPAAHFIKEMNAFVTSSDLNENHKIVMITYQ